MTKKPDNFLINLFARLSISITIIGVLGKIQHWEITDFFLLQGLILMPIFYTIKFFREEKRIMDFIKLGLIITFSLRAFVIYYHHPFSHEVGILQMVFFILWIIGNALAHFGVKVLEPYDLNKNSYLLKGIVIVIPFVIIGALFKIMHWPYASDLLKISFGIISIAVISDLSIQKLRLR